MSTGAVVNPVGVGGGAAGAATTPIGQGTRPLTSDAVFRIEVSLSSRKSSAIVMKTTARLYSLEGATPAVPGASPGKTIFIRSYDKCCSNSKIGPHLQVYSVHASHAPQLSKSLQLAHDPLSSLAYLVIIHTPLVASNLILLL